MIESNSRAERYRERAAALARDLEKLPASEQASALRYHDALLHMAAIGEWAQSTPKARLFKDYKLKPRPMPPTRAQALSRKYDG